MAFRVFVTGGGGFVGASVIEELMVWYLGAMRFSHRRPYCGW